MTIYLAICFDKLVLWLKHPLTVCTVKREYKTYPITHYGAIFKLYDYIFIYTYFLWARSNRIFPNGFFKKRQLFSKDSKWTIFQFSPLALFEYVPLCNKTKIVVKYWALKSSIWSRAYLALLKKSIPSLYEPLIFTTYSKQKSPIIWALLKNSGRRDRVSGLSIGAITKKSH